MTWAALVTGWVVPTGLRSLVVRLSRRAGLALDAWLECVIHDRAELEEVAALLGVTPRELQSRALRHYASAIGVPAMSVDNGDEYGQRVVQHTAMVRGMGNG